MSKIVNFYYLVRALKHDMACAFYVRSKDA